MRVIIDDEFFKKERNQTYSDWELSIWRELFQNSIDQGADVIRINLTPIEVSPGVHRVRLTFFDNGPGMTREVLERVYFAIGATTKTGTGQIGGMGRARVLTCFSMPAYVIRSDDYLVLGHGGEYDIMTMPKLTGTCTLIIDVDDSTIERLRFKLKTFLEESHITARIYIDDTLTTIRAGHLGRHNRDLSADGETFAKVYINKSLASQRVIVRVNGASMYTTETSAKAQIIIELDSAKAREALTSNRDGLRGNYRRALNNFLRELAVDVESSLRARFTRHTKVIRGGGLKQVRQKRKPVPRTCDESAQMVFRADVATSSAPRVAQSDDTYIENQVQRDPFGEWLAHTFGDIFVFDELEGQSAAAMHKAVPNYLPDNWQPLMLNGKTHRKGGNIAKVLLMWQTTVAYALEVALEPLGLDSVSYGVGFLFTDDRQAEKRTEGDGHLFLLRPINREGKLDYSVRERASLKRLMTWAKHEVSHIAVSWHSEAFSAIREAIDSRFDDSECFRRMKAALDAVPDFDAQAKMIEQANQIAGRMAA